MVVVICRQLNPFRANLRSRLKSPHPNPSPAGRGAKLPFSLGEKGLGDEGA